MGVYLFATIQPDLFDLAGEVHFSYIAEADIGAKTLGLLPELFHHFRAHDTFRVAGKILYIGGLHELSAHFQSGVHDRAEVGTGGIDGSSITGRAGSDDKCLDDVHTLRFQVVKRANLTMVPLRAGEGGTRI